MNGLRRGFRIGLFGVTPFWSVCVYCVFRFGLQAAYIVTGVVFLMFAAVLLMLWWTY